MIGACSHDPEPPPLVVAAPPKPVVRGAVGDDDLRVMLSELAASKACTLIKGQFRPLRAPDRPGVVTGMLWIRNCVITNDGTHVTFHLAGNGWEWADQTKHKAGGTFVVRQYVKFGMDTTISGALDLAYDREHHVVSMYFSPDKTPAVIFTPIGDVDVDREGAWSSVIAGLGSIFASSPEETAEGEAKKTGTHEMKNQLVEGMAATINLCTGLSRFNLGRPPKGQMAKAEAGETTAVPVDVQPGGLMMFGPQLAGNGMTLDVDVTTGGAKVVLACADQAAIIADAFLAGTTSDVPKLATADVRGKHRFHIPDTRCLVVALAQPLDNQPATFTWKRPATEIAQSTGGPLIHCDGTKPSGAPSKPSTATVPPKSKPVDPDPPTGKPVGKPPAPKPVSPRTLNG